METINFLKKQTMSKSTIEKKEDTNFSNINFANLKNTKSLKSNKA